MRHIQYQVETLPPFPFLLVLGKFRIYVIHASVRKISNICSTKGRGRLKLKKLQSVCDALRVGLTHIQYQGETLLPSPLLAFHLVLGKFHI